MAQDMFSPPAAPAPVTVQGMLPTPGAGQFREMQTDKPYVPMQRLGFWPQVGKYVEQGTHQSLAKYFGIADKMGFTDALNEDEFNHIKGERPMLFRPGFSRKTWENEIDAHDVGKVMEGLEINGIDSTFAMVVGSVLGGFTDPVNVAGMYLAPMVGAMALGANALSRGAVAHILRTEGPEALVKFLSASPTGYFQQVKRAAIFGAAEGVAEIPADKYLSELTGQRTYTAADAGLNILTGAALSATVTGVLDPALSGTMRAVQKRWNKTFKETNTFAGQLAAKGINDGRPVTVAEVEANVAKMDTYQSSAKRQVERTDGKKAMTPERATPTPQRVNLTVPDVTHPSGAPLDFKGDDVSKGLYAVAGGNKDVEDQLMRALIDNGTFHADVPSTREALQQAAAEIKTKVDAQGSGGIDKIRYDVPPRAREFGGRGEDKKRFVPETDREQHNRIREIASIAGAELRIVDIRETGRKGPRYEAGVVHVPTFDDYHPDTAWHHPNFVAAHEVAHVVTERGFEGKDKLKILRTRLKELPNWEALKERAAELWQDIYRGSNKHREKPEEVLADVVADVIRGESDIRILEPYMDAFNMQHLRELLPPPSKAPTVSTKPVKVKVDGIPTLARIRDTLIPKAAVLKAETPEAQAAVDHTVRPSDHDLLVGQDYKAAQIAAIDNHSNQLTQDMEDYGRKYGDMTDETIKADVDYANGKAKIMNAIRACPIG